MQLLFSKPRVCLTGATLSPRMPAAMDRQEDQRPMVVLNPYRSESVQCLAGRSTQKHELWIRRMKPAASRQPLHTRSTQLASIGNGDVDSADHSHWRVLWPQLWLRSTVLLLAIPVFLLFDRLMCVDSTCISHPTAARLSLSLWSLPSLSPNPHPSVLSHYSSPSCPPSLLVDTETSSSHPCCPMFDSSNLSYDAFPCHPLLALSGVRPSVVPLFPPSDCFASTCSSSRFPIHNRVSHSGSCSVPATGSQCSAVSDSTDFLPRPLLAVSILNCALIFIALANSWPMLVGHFPSYVPSTWVSCRRVRPFYALVLVPVKCLNLSSDAYGPSRLVAWSDWRHAIGVCVVLDVIVQLCTRWTSGWIWMRTRIGRISLFTWWLWLRRKNRRCVNRSRQAIVDVTLRRASERCEDDGDSDVFNTNGESDYSACHEINHRFPIENRHNSLLRTATETALEDGKWNFRTHSMSSCKRKPTTSSNSSAYSLVASSYVVMMLLGAMTPVAVSSTRTSASSPPSTVNLLAPVSSLPPVGRHGGGNSGGSTDSRPKSSGAVGGGIQPVAHDDLNPWLSADGGRILRVFTGNSLNWLRPNPGSCAPNPSVPACPHDRHCRLPDTASSRLRPLSAFSERSRMDSNGHDVDTGWVNDVVDRHQPDDMLVEMKATPKATTNLTDGGLISNGNATRDTLSSDHATSTVVSSNISQCLPYLHSAASRSIGGGDSSYPSPAECICGHADGAKRIDMLRKYHLHHCFHYNLWHVLSDTMREGITRSRSQCFAYLDVVERLDNLAAHFVCQFEDIIRRYDCAQTFSSKSSCQRCKTAYRQWACSMVLPMWLNGERVKPCRRFCHEVERLCPYFLPAEKTGPGSQYAGEPSFLCIDPDVRETTNQSTNSAYNDRTCYRPCTLDYNLEPDVDPKECVASLGTDDDAIFERTDIGEGSGNCQQIDSETNGTHVSISYTYDVGDNGDNTYTDDHCPPNSKGSSGGIRQVPSGAEKTPVLFGSRGRRTIVLPIALLLLLLHFFLTQFSTCPVI